MLSTQLAMSFLGALGLFLIGMWLMTEGLKIAGGQALEHLLGKWISTRLRGFLAGLMVTGLVQSSSAVTVATIGFINARLMTFSQSVWVIFGSNVGTTLTAWLVLLVGFKFDISAFTLPLIGIGALLKVFAPNLRAQSLGMALAGFGLLFMGISSLQGAFAGLTPASGELPDIGASPLFLGLALGFLMTVLTQSSSAGIAIILTASASGMTTIELASSAVIGANVGTTTTALIAAIGATNNGKRLAAAHVIFNLMTAVVAVLLLLVLLFWLRDLNLKPDDMALFLAIFHTGFNILGVLLMLPFEPKLSRWLMGWFKSKGQPLVDSNLAVVPDLALRALEQQLKHFQAKLLALPMTKEPVNLDPIAEGLSALQRFITLASQNQLTKAQSAKLEHGLNALHRLQAALETYREAQGFDMTLPTPVEGFDDWLALVQKLSELQFGDDQAAVDENWLTIQNEYANIRNKVIHAAVTQRWPSGQLDPLLKTLSSRLHFQRRMLQASESLVAFATKESVKEERQPAN
ncbi:Na/Pi symporter [Aliiglaciecola sp. CAU 1673]|uniref:Na/Pi cotransporter family protein n=1 Tax=Aliiglaciecola sp. CAU 1673 TaxID=3032595 RepID=UPI0023DA013F|nr:Na/Pi symporter [Aliiglaciecola sp. CAU 1673]MDF2180214.1 Na/Pi symporter [Aliiglaciecola sp. CAU 1673]